MRPILLIASVVLVGLAGCSSPAKPDYTINLVPGADGKLVAVPPKCPSWQTETADNLSNDPWPQFGCATARNLAAQIERPEDLIRGRDWGDANGEQTANAMRRYIQDKTYPMIDASPDGDQPVASAGGRTTTSAGAGGAAAGAAP